MEIKQRRDYIKLMEDMHNEIVPSIQSVFNFNPWPVIRIQSAYFFHLLFVGRVPNKGENLTYKRNALPLKQLIQYLLVSIKLLALTGKFKNRLKGKVLLVGFEKHKINLLGQKVNIYTEPFKDYFDDLNIPAEILWIDKKSTAAGGQSLEHLLVLLQKKHAAKTAVKRALFLTDERQYKNTFNIAQAVRNFLQKRGSEHATAIAAKVQENILKNEVAYQALIQFLEITAPKKIVNYCYYNNDMLALQRAANYLNISITEYQHSIQADDHFAYANWTGSDDYCSLFPSQYWVWSTDEAERIKRNFGDKNYHPGIIIGGNVFLTQQKEKYVNDKPQGKGVLITLQGSWIPGFIETVIKQRKDITWYFRLHPRYPDDKAKLDVFYQQNPDNVEMKLANELPLYSLFQKVQFNITSSSGTALEAMSFNVTNLIFGQDGFNCFESYIKNDEFYFVDNAELLNTLLNTKEGSSVELVQQVSSKTVGDNLTRLYYDAAL